MKSKYTLLFAMGLVLCSGLSFSQNIAINSTGSPADAQSMLDITSTTSGLLIPRMTAAQRTAISATAASDYGLLVYQTDGTAGFYYWDGTVWRYLLASGGGAAGWTTNGNAGTTFGTNFLGTTDAVGLDIRTSNAIRMSILSSGYVGIGTTNPTRPLQVVGSGVGLHTASFLNTTGYGVAIGSTTGSVFGSIQAFDNNLASSAPLVLQTALGGYVGIGTTTPSTHLEVSAADQRTAITVVNTSGTAARNPRVNIYNYNSFGGSPVLQFHNMRGTSAAPAATQLSDALGNVDFGGHDGSALYDGAQIQGIATENATATNHGSAIAFTNKANGSTSMVERMRIDQSGHIGIGITTPGVLPNWTALSNMRVLEITGDASAGTFTDGVLIMSNNRATATVGDQNGAVLFGHRSNSGNFSAAITSYLSGAGGANGFGANLEFHTKPDNVLGHALRMVILNNGNVGIGTASPSTRIHVAGGPVLAQGLLETAYTAPATVGNATYLNYYYASNNWAGIGGYTNGAMWYRGQDHVFWTPGTLVGSPTYVMIFNQAGNLGIGTTAPGYVLTVNGQPGANGYTAFTNYSDARLKKNISGVDNSLEKIMKLRPVQFNYNEEYLRIYNDSTSLRRLHKGFIAQEVKEIFPEMVGSKTINGKEYLDLNLSNLQVYLVKAMQEQQMKIEELNRRIQELEMLLKQNSATTAERK